MWVEKPKITLDAGAPPSGRYGALPEDAIHASQRLLNEVLGQMPPVYLQIGMDVKDSTKDRFTESALALGKAHGFPWPHVICANVSYDIAISMGCTTVALPGSRGPVVARNMDWPMQEALARASRIMSYESGGKVRYAHAGFSASIGVVTGMSDKGFCLVVNAAESPEEPKCDGYPVLLFMRKVLEEAASFDDALKMLSEQPLAVGAMVTLVGTENGQRVVVERSPTKHALRWAEDGKPLVTTNYYQSLPSKDVADVKGGWKCPRYERMSELLAKDTEGRKGTSFIDPQDDDLLGMLADAGVRQDITAQHVVMRPRLMEMRLFVPSELVGGAS